MSDPTQYVLDEVDPWRVGTTYQGPPLPMPLETYGNGKQSLDKDMRWRRNAFEAQGFIRSVLNRIGYPPLYDRVLALFQRAMQQTGFRWGSTATRIIGSCIFIVLREASQGVTLRTVAQAMNLPEKRLSRFLWRTVYALGIKLPVSDPLSHVPQLLKLVSDVRNDPARSLPAPLHSFLSKISLNAVHNLATSLHYISEKVQLTHNRVTPPVACALFIMALEGQTGRAAPCLLQLTNFLANGLGATPSTVTDRYLEYQTLISQWKMELPWLVTPPAKRKPQRKGQLPQREEHASLLKDVVAFQEELWKRTQEKDGDKLSGVSEDSSTASTPSLNFELSTDEEDTVSEDGESLELGIFPSFPVALPPILALDDPASALSPLAGQSSEDHRAAKRRRIETSPVPAVPDPRKAPERRINNACLRPSYAQRNTPKMDREVRMEKAAATLLGGFANAGQAASDSGVARLVRSHVLANGPNEHAENSRKVTRLSALTALVGEPNVADDELFDEGEMEAIIRSEEQAEVLTKRWEEMYPETDLPRRGKRVRATKNINALALEQALNGLNVKRSHDSDTEGDGAWDINQLASLMDDDDEKGDDQYHVESMASLEEFSHSMASGTYDPFADYEEL